MPAPDVTFEGHPAPSDPRTDEYGQNDAAQEYNLACASGLFRQRDTQLHRHDNDQCRERPERRIGQLSSPATLRGDVRQVAD